MAKDWNADDIQVKLQKLHLSSNLHRPEQPPEWDADSINAKLKEILRVTPHPDCPHSDDDNPPPDDHSSHD